MISLDCIPWFSQTLSKSFLDAILDYEENWRIECSPKKDAVMSFQFPTDTEKRYTKKLKKKTRPCRTILWSERFFFFLPSTYLQFAIYKLFKNNFFMKIVWDRFPI